MKTLKIISGLFFSLLMVVWLTGSAGILEVAPFLFVGGVFVSMTMRTKGLAMIGCASLTDDILLDCAAPLIGGNTDRMLLFNKSDIASVTRNDLNTLIVEAFTMGTTSVKDGIITIGSVTGGPFEVEAFTTTSGAAGNITVVGSGRVTVTITGNKQPQIGDTLTGTTSAAHALITAQNLRGFVYEGRFNSVQPSTKMLKQKYSRPYDHQVIFNVFSATPTTKAQLEAMVQGNIVAVIENNNQGDEGEGAFEIYGLDTGLVVQDLGRTLQDADTQGAFAVTLASSDLVKEPHLPASFFVTDYATTQALINGYLV